MAPRRGHRVGSDRQYLLLHRVRSQRLKSSPIGRNAIFEGRRSPQVSMLGCAARESRIDVGLLRRLEAVIDLCKR